MAVTPNEFGLQDFAIPPDSDLFFELQIFAFPLGSSVSEPPTSVVTSHWRDDSTIYSYWRSDASISGQWQAFSVDSTWRDDSTVESLWRNDATVASLWNEGV